MAFVDGTTMFRSSHRRCSIKKSFQKIFKYSQETHMLESPTYVKVRLSPSKKICLFLSMKAL